MTDRKPLAGLTEDEWKGIVGLLNYASVHTAMDASIVTEIADSLSRCRERSERRRALLEKHQWAPHSVNTKLPYCPECVRDKNEGHTDDCKWAAGLAGTEGGNDVKKK